MPHYYAIAEAGEDGFWWISFPGRAGITSGAEDARQIVAQARDALEIAAADNGLLPPSIEEGAMPPGELTEYDSSAMIVVIPFLPPE